MRMCRSDRTVCIHVMGEGELPLRERSLPEGGALPGPSGSTPPLD